MCSNKRCIPSNTPQRDNECKSAHSTFGQLFPSRHVFQLITHTTTAPRATADGKVGPAQQSQLTASLTFDGSQSRTFQLLPSPISRSGYRSVLLLLHKLEHEPTGCVGHLYSNTRARVRGRSKERQRQSARNENSSRERCTDREKHVQRS